MKRMKRLMLVGFLFKEDFEILFSKSEDYEHFDILNDHIYYLDSNSQLKCQDIQSGEITYIG